MLHRIHLPSSLRTVDQWRKPTLQSYFPAFLQWPPYPSILNRFLNTVVTVESNVLVDTVRQHRSPAHRWRASFTVQDARMCTFYNGARSDELTRSVRTLRVLADHPHILRWLPLILTFIEKLPSLVLVLLLRVSARCSACNRCNCIYTYILSIMHMKSLD